MKWLLAERGIELKISINPPATQVEILFEKFESKRGAVLQGGHIT